MSRFAFVATAGAGGDLQPLVGAALGLRRRGHDVTFAGDRVAAGSALAQGFPAIELPEGTELGPRLAAVVRQASAAQADPAGAGRLVKDELAAWAHETATPVRSAVRDLRADAVVTSLFGVEVLYTAGLRVPWAVINSTFYIGPSPPRPIQDDFHPRTVALVSRFADLLGSAALVLHATDRQFDLDFSGLPAHHRYVGPLGIWEPPAPPLDFVTADGDPWILVSVSTQRQDDLPIAAAALSALAGRPFRVLVTVGPGHQLNELPDLPANAQVVQEASHASVLEHSSLMIGHAGHGSVMKALWHGTPMVLVPWSRDQPGVAARAVALGVAESLPRDQVSPERLAGAIDKVLSSSAMTHTAARHSQRIRASDPQDVAGAELERLTS